jgi:uncharacterized protein (TIGR02145 family)
MPTKPTIQDQTFLFTGTLTEFTREDAEAHVEAEGGKVLSGVSAKLNYLVVGQDAGSKLAKAEALGTVTILHEKEFLKMMSSGKKAPAKAAPKKTVKATPKAAPKKIAKSTAKVNSVSKQDSTKTAIDEIKIGKQIWCVKNLDVTNFRNGDPIPESKTKKEWVKAGENGKPAWCYYENKNVKLYNWYAVNDPRGLAPKGYHIPSDEEWTILTDYLGGELKAGTKMKSASGWHENSYSAHGNGTNSSGFAGFPGGSRLYDGSFSTFDSDGCWWSSTESNTSYAWYRYLNCNNGYVYRKYYYKSIGYSVRCLRDTAKVNSVSKQGKAAPKKTVKAIAKAAPNKITKSTAKVNSVSKQDSTKTAIDEIKIGKQIWCVKNLDVANFRNGDSIPESKTKKEWVKAGENEKPAWCYYENKTSNGTKYGKLYNWYAVNDPRGLAPKGYHIPSDEEWTILTDYLGVISLRSVGNKRVFTAGELKAGKKMKSSFGWNENGNGTNSSGFAGFPGGCRGYDGVFYNIGRKGYWWSATEDCSIDAWSRDAWSRYLDCLNVHIFSYHNRKQNAFSVRCLGD